MNRSKIFLHFLSLITLCCFYSATSAQTIRGRVIDSNTGEPLVGAVVNLKGTNFYALVKLDGTFSFPKLSAGTYTPEVSFQGYKPANLLSPIALKDKETKTISVTLESLAVAMQSITITAGSNDKDGNARRLERVADPVLNVLSAKAIQLLPDITVANAMQRISGVTIEKSSSGEARYPIIRGMEKRYINTLVNGIKIPSPDNKNRYIPLDLFPSELLERLEVSKSLTPSMEGDAIGGTINLVMKDAPATKLLQTNFSLGYNTILSNQTYQKFDAGSINKMSPAEMNGATYLATPKDFSVAHLNYTDKANPINSTFGLTYGNRFGKNKKFGFIFSGSHQNIYRGTTSNFFLPNSQPGLNNIPLFSDLQLRKYSVQSKRLGINAKLDYQINSNNKISLTNTFVRLDDYQTRIVYDTVALNSVIDNWQRSTWQYQTINNTTLQGLHKFNKGFKLDWSASYSAAANHIPDQSQFIHQYAIVATSLTADKLQKISHVWGHNNDKDFSTYVNLTKNTSIFGKSLELKTGALVRRKNRTNFYNSYTLDPVLGALYTNINSANFIFNPTSSGTPSLNGNNYSFKENVTAGYIQGKLALSKKLEALGGVRYEDTYQYYETQLGPETDARLGTIKYHDFLPSLQLKYALKQNQNVRFTYYKALARPGFAEMIPDGPDGEFFKEYGNPVGLVHTLADNLDLRYELYANNADQILLGAFYKNIDGPIEIAAVKPKNINSLYLLPVNSKKATNYGFEAVFTKYFGNFGISANYTYTKSSISNDSMLYSYRGTTGASYLKYVSETRPLQGQSNHIGNLSLIYKNPKLGLDVQAALVYTGERISFVSPYAGLHYWQSPTTQIDLSFEKRIVKHLTFYGKMLNLNDAPFELSLHQSYNDYMATSGSRALALQSDPTKKIIVQKDYYKASFLFGFRYKF